MWNPGRFRESPWSYSLGLAAFSILLEVLAALLWSGEWYAFAGNTSLVAIYVVVVAWCLVTVELIYGRFPLVIRGGQIAVVFGSYPVAQSITWSAPFPSFFVMELAAMLLLVASLLALERTVRRTILFKYTSGTGSRISHLWSLREMFSLTFLIAVLFASLSGTIRDYQEHLSFASFFFHRIGPFLPPLLVLRGMLDRTGVQTAAMCFGLAGLTSFAFLVFVGIEGSLHILSIAAAVLPVLGVFFCGWRLRHVGWAIQARPAREARPFNGERSPAPSPAAESSAAVEASSAVLTGTASPSR